MTWEPILILVLILANGVFAMAEIAVVSSRRARLKQLADAGSKRAGVALKLSEDPDDFLSTVQVGITLIGTLAGAFGGATVAEQLRPMIEQFPTLAPYASTLSITIVVIAITYLSLILGELAPKRIALARPEVIAAAVAPIMKGLSRVAHPAVQFLSWSTDVVLKLFPKRAADEAPVTEDEIRILVEQGTKAGVFEVAEQGLISGVFRLGDRRVGELMTPRHEVVWLDVNAPAERIRQQIAEAPHSRLPAAEGDLDRVVGIVAVKDLFVQIAAGLPLDLRTVLQKPLFIPEGTRALRALELFQTSGLYLALILNEHGGVEGLLTITDLLTAVVGRMPEAGAEEESPIVQREDGSWLVEGWVPVSELKEKLPVPDLPGENEGAFTTVGGFIMMTLERVPRSGDRIEQEGWRFEVVDMDGNRVDKVMVSGPGHGRHVVSETSAD